jgi:hypothetical protein
VPAAPGAPLHSIIGNKQQLWFQLPWWDRLFGTYRPQPSAGQSGMTIGIEQFRDARKLRLDRMLIQPFYNEVGNYPFGHRQNER